MANRYFVDELPPAGPARLEGPLAHHLGTVLRLRPGETCTLADGRGGAALATIATVGKRCVDVQVSPATTAPPPARRLHLAFAPPRLARAEWLFEHGTEVGVAVFHPLWTARTRPQGDRLERWQKIANAAAGQCDRNFLPELRAPRELAAFLADATLPARRFVGAGDGGPFTAADTAPGDAVLLIGPEGGFDPAEHAAVAAAGFVPRTFGPHILRTETAAIVGAGIWLAAGC
ncbi:MAG: 16S rRNA (uracil(1498)-N(3))-methyltransferase [Planctomycetes bacterium]|nr:16S rRNA (uracil(1498)-N(3))-methyltransferase [Planctomycetota bacterium]